MSNGMNTAGAQEWEHSTKPGHYGSVDASVADVGRFRKKPVEIEAVQWDGTGAASLPIVNWIVENGGTARYQSPNPHLVDGLFITTLEGNLRATAGDWIIRGIQGEFYPCKPDIFAATYNEVTPV